MNKENNWYVITGGPCAGKTTVAEELERRGYRVQYEMARIYLDEKIAEGSTVSEERKDEGEFQKKILKLKVDLEEKLPKGETIFFDRAIPDSIAYYEIAGLSASDEYMKKAVENCGYKKVFLLDLVDFKRDYARTESEEEVKRIQLLLEKSFKEAGVPIVKVPVISTKEERVDFILKNL